MNIEKKRHGRVIMNRIRDVLYKDWDPAGVHGLAPNDEYDSYIAGVYRLIFFRGIQ